MLRYPNFDPVAFRIPLEFNVPVVGLHVGPVAVRWYGIMYLIGFAAAWWLGQRRARRAKSPVSPMQIDDLIFYGALGVILGGRVGYMIFYGRDQLLENPASFLRIWEGGMSFHGGLIGVTAAMALYASKARIGFLELMDFVAPLIPIGLGAGRIGNFINGELWGKPTELAWGFLVDGIGRHASQLYEATLEGAVLFAIVWSFSARPRPVMSVAGMFLLFYGIFRFVIEFLRLPDAQIGYLAFGWLTMGQVLSLPMLFGGLLMLALAFRGSSRLTESYR
jgi:phosphatidylglycerol:prolipoprotein diacylglycerol transferase